MSLTFFNQYQIAKICTTIFKKFGLKPEFMENRMCGLTTSVNLINNLSELQLIDIQKVPPILEILLEFNNQRGLKMGSLTDPDSFRSFDSDGNMFHNAAISIFTASKLYWLPIFNPAKSDIIYPLLNPHTNLFLSINNAKLNGSRHLVCLDERYLIDPIDPVPICDYKLYLDKHWVNWSSLIVSTKPINTALISQSVKLKPIFKTQEDIQNNPPGTSPWPVFIPDLVTEKIRNVINN